MSNLKPVNPTDFENEFDSLDEGEIVQLVGLKLGDEEYAIDVLKIQEIIRTVEITAVPRTDSFVLGVMNLRGKVIPVVDLRIRFNLDKMDFDKETRIIVVRFDTEQIGFVVDQVTEVIRINKNMVEPTPPLVGSIGQEYILGICKYDDRLIILLDIDTVISEGKTVPDSDLRKRFLGQPALEAKALISMDDVAATIEQEELSGESSEGDSLQAFEDEDSAEEAASTDIGEIDDIDALIAMELAKREQETDELNKKKQESESHKAERDTDVEDILNDALSQSDKAINGDQGYVVQDELDALIAQELAKREKETEELNRLRKEEEKKNEKLKEEEEFDVSAFFNEQATQQSVQTDEVVLSDEEEPVLEVSESVKADDELFRTETTVALDDLLPEDVDDIEQLLKEAEQLQADDASEKLEQISEEALAEEIPASAKPVESAEEPKPEPVSFTSAAPKHDPFFHETDSIDDLKEISRKIINGDAVDLGVDLKGEIGELLRLILDTKKKVDEIDPTILMSKESMPVVMESLEQVNEKTEEATLNLMSAADRMTGFYSQFLSDLDDLEELVYKKDAQGLLKNINRIENDISAADNLGFGILHALEFQDITEQKLVKVIKSVEEIGARIGAVLGIIKAKKDETGGTIEGASQDDIDSLLAEFGLN